MSAVNTPLRGAKQQNYEGGIRTPFIVSWPAAFKGGRTRHPDQLARHLPTALEAAGVPRRPPNHSTAEKPAAAAHRKTSRHLDTFYWSEGGEAGGFAVRSGDWKLVQQRSQPKIELFNLAKDPAEATDLAPQNAAKVAELMKLYDTWLDQMAHFSAGWRSTASTACSCSGSSTPSRGPARSRTTTPSSNTAAPGRGSTGGCTR
jgi:arylsulfatase A-like enzyme